MDAGDCCQQDEKWDKSVNFALKYPYACKKKEITLNVQKLSQAFQVFSTTVNHLVTTIKMSQGSCCSVNGLSYPLKWNRMRTKVDRSIIIYEASSEENQGSIKSYISSDSERLEETQNGRSLL